MKKRGHFKPAMREFVDIDYWEQLSDEDKKYLEDFLGGYYDHRFKGRVSPKHKSQAYRREYLARHDVYNYSRRTGGLEYLSERPTALMDDIKSTVMDFEETYKHCGYDASLEVITTTLLNALDEGITRPNVALERYYLQRDKLRRMRDNDKRIEAERRKKNGG